MSSLFPLFPRVHSVYHWPMLRTPPDFAHESAALARGAAFVLGVDEVGRGPLAGPVTAAAVRLDPARIPPGLGDSKVLSPATRERLCAEVMQVAQVGLGHATVEEIDRMNILRASHLAMTRAICALVADFAPPGVFALVDGNLLPRDMPCAGLAIIRGDAKSLSIAAASIVAKVTRDRIMVDLAQQHPGYGWETNAGYPTAAHLAALLNLGVTAWHRRSFRPVHNILYQDNSITL